MSAIGTKRTSLVALHMSAFGGKADIRQTFFYARLSFSNWSSIASKETRVREFGWAFVCM